MFTQRNHTPLHLERGGKRIILRFDLGVLVFNLVVSSAGFALGSVYLKRFADAGGWGNLGCAFLIFGVSNLVYAQVLAKGLGHGAAISSMAHLVLMSIAGVALFGERLGALHFAGLANALATIWLFTLASQSA